MVLSAIALVVLVVAPLGAIPASRDGLAVALEEREAIHTYTVSVEQGTFQALINVTPEGAMAASTQALEDWGRVVGARQIPDLHRPIQREAAQAHALLLVAVDSGDPQEVAPAFGTALESAGLGLQASNELIDQRLTEIASATPAFASLQPDIQSARDHLVADRIIAHHARALGQVGVELAVATNETAGRAELRLLEAERSLSTLRGTRPDRAADAITLSEASLAAARILLLGNNSGPDGLTTLWPLLDQALASLEELRDQEAVALADDLAQASQEALLAAWLAGGGAIILAAAAPAAVVVLRRRVLRPVLALHNATESTRPGQIAPMGLVTSQDEIGDLARSFAAMTGRLEQSNQQLRNALQETTDARDALQRSLERLSEADRLRQHILNTASHELRTPLTPMRIHLKLLAAETKGALNDDQKRSVATLDANLQRLVSVITAMAQMHDLQSGAAPLHIVNVDLVEVADDACRAAATAMTNAGIEIHCEPSPPVPARADAARLRQVLDILLDNARTYSEAGSQVTVRTLPGRVIEVIDQGRGMRPEDIERLFAPFERGVGQADAPGAAGLGLAIARALMEGMGGTLSGSSPGPGKGSTFRLSLPPSL